MGIHLYKYLVIFLLICVQGFAVDAATTETPTFSPTKRPTKQPASKAPSATPSHLPTSIPTGKPTSYPTSVPTVVPTSIPTTAPTSKPTSAPSSRPSSAPTSCPSRIPTTAPIAAPTNKPTPVPTHEPTFAPSAVPSFAPTVCPSLCPTHLPSTIPTHEPTFAPSAVPSFAPSVCPSLCPTHLPSTIPTAAPTATPSALPSYAPSEIPTAEPTLVPTCEPTPVPSTEPSAVPSDAPSTPPTAPPSTPPTAVPSTPPTAAPSTPPTAVPSTPPTAAPSTPPTAAPSTPPTAAPSTPPTAVPSTPPTAAPSTPPTAAPSAAPSATPTAPPSTAYPSPVPTTHMPTVVPTIAPNVYNIVSFDVLQLFDNISYDAYVDSTSAQLSLNMAVASSISGITTAQVTQTKTGLISAGKRDKLISKAIGNDKIPLAKNIIKLMELSSKEDTISVTYSIAFSSQKMGYNNDSDAFVAISQELMNVVMSGQFDDYWHGFSTLLGVSDIVSRAKTSFFEVETDSYSVVDTQPTSRPTSSPSTLRPTEAPSNNKKEDGDEDGLKAYKDWNILFQILFPLVLILAFLTVCYVWSHTECASWCYRGLCHPPDSNLYQYASSNREKTFKTTSTQKGADKNTGPVVEERKKEDDSKDTDDDIEAQEARCEACGGAASPSTHDKYFSSESVANVPIIPRIFLRETLENKRAKSSSGRTIASHSVCRESTDGIDQGTGEGIQLRKAKSKSRPAARINDTFTSPFGKGTLATSSTSGRGAHITQDSMAKAAAAAAFVTPDDNFSSPREASAYTKGSDQPPPPALSPEYIDHSNNKATRTASPHGKCVAFDISLSSLQRSSSSQSSSSNKGAAALAPPSSVMTSSPPVTATAAPFFRKPRQVTDAPRSSEKMTEKPTACSADNGGYGNYNRKETPKLKEKASQRNLQSVARQEERVRREVKFTGVTRRSSQVRAAVSALIVENRLKQQYRPAGLKSPEKAEVASSLRSPNNSAPSRSSRNKARLAMRGVKEEAAAEAEYNKPRLFVNSTGSRIREADLVAL